MKIGHGNSQTGPEIISGVRQGELVFIGNRSQVPRGCLRAGQNHGNGPNHLFRQGRLSEGGRRKAEGGKKAMVDETHFLIEEEGASVRAVGSTDASVCVACGTMAGAVIAER